MDKIQNGNEIDYIIKSFKELFDDIFFQTLDDIYDEMFLILSQKTLEEIGKKFNIYLRPFIKEALMDIILSDDPNKLSGQVFDELFEKILSVLEPETQEELKEKWDKKYVINVFTPIIKKAVFNICYNGIKISC